MTTVFSPLSSLSHINTQTTIRAIHLVRIRDPGTGRPGTGTLDMVNLDQVPRPVRGKPRAGEFVFARLRYDSGDWDYNPKVAANVLNSIVEYTNIAVYPEEVVITADSDELLAFPFLFMTGHKLVRFSDRERERLREFVERGGFLFSDDCNHDVAGLYATSFEQEMHRAFPGPGTLDKLPRTHRDLSIVLPVSRRTAADRARTQWVGRRPRARLPARRRATRGRIGVLYSNKDYGCEWDYDWRNKRFQRDDNTRFSVNLVVYALGA